MPLFEAPDKDCPLCPRLCSFRAANKAEYPHFFNGAVPAFGDLASELLIVGLAPGLQGANATGRPFTGDYAGDVLYAALLAGGFAQGRYESPRGAAISGVYADGLRLNNCRITNAVRCVPPENKPEPDEIRRCNVFLQKEMAAMPNLRVVLSLGLISHNAVLVACGFKPARAKFAHAARHDLANGVVLLDSYHCSRYNINTGRLSQAMFNAVVHQAAQILASQERVRAS